MQKFKPKFSITNQITGGLTKIERVRGFLEAATLSEDWIRQMGERALVLEAHYTTHIEGTRLTLNHSERILAGQEVDDADPDDVRERDMDMTGWLEYFVSGLITQMEEVKVKGEQSIRCDVLVTKHKLNERQAKALSFLLKHGKLTIQDYEALCTEPNRRSLQRDLRMMLDKGVIHEVGAGATDPTRHYVIGQL